jgi:hypothetical protein
MRLNTHPENLIERIALRAGVVPTPVQATQYIRTKQGFCAKVTLLDCLP